MALRHIPRTLLDMSLFIVQNIYMEIVYNYSHDLKDRIFGLRPSYLNRKIPIPMQAISMYQKEP